MLCCLVRCGMPCVFGCACLMIYMVKSADVKWVKQTHIMILLKRHAHTHTPWEEGKKTQPKKMRQIKAKVFFRQELNSKQIKSWKNEKVEATELSWKYFIGWICRTMRIKWMMKCWFLHKSPPTTRIRPPALIPSCCVFFYYFLFKFINEIQSCVLSYLCGIAVAVAVAVIVVDVVVSITIAIADAIAMHIVYMVCVCVCVHEFRVCRVNYAESLSHLSKINEIVPKNRKFKSIQYWMCVCVCVCARTWAWACACLHACNHRNVVWWQMFLCFPSSPEKKAQPHTQSRRFLFRTDLSVCGVFLFSARVIFAKVAKKPREQKSE